MICCTVFPASQKPTREATMAGAGEETDAGIELVLAALERLRAKDAGHELLRFSEGFGYTRLPESFRARFGGEHIPECHRGTEFAYAAMCLNYYEALRAALGETN
jgi:hypothetical protein